jgi:nucleoside phosphorylase
MSSRLTTGDFDVGVICALSFEGAAVEAVFDELYKDVPGLPEEVSWGRITYQLSLGRVGKKYVVLIWLRKIGTKEAGGARIALQHVYPEINIFFVVGICGGVPSAGIGAEPVIGDVVISTNILPHDIGKQIHGTFLLTEKPYMPTKSQSFLSKHTSPLRKQKLEDRLLQVLEMARLTTTEEGRSKISYQGVEKDVLYVPDHHHKHNTLCCNEGSCPEAQRSTCVEVGCDKSRVVKRMRLCDPKNPPKPIIHFGTVGSGNRVMKSGQERDHLARLYQIIAFEKEGAGVFDDGLDVYVIKGICDYADGHKNMGWQNYSAYAAAGAFKAFLEEYPGRTTKWKHHLRLGAEKLSSPTKYIPLVGGKSSQQNPYGFTASASIDPRPKNPRSRASSIFNATEGRSASPFQVFAQDQDGFLVVPDASTDDSLAISASSQSSKLPKPQRPELVSRVASTPPPYKAAPKQSPLHGAASTQGSPLTTDNRSLSIAINSQPEQSLVRVSTVSAEVPIVSDPYPKAPDPWASIQDRQGDDTEKTIKPALADRTKVTAEGTTGLNKVLDGLSLRAALSKVDPGKLPTREETVREIVDDASASIPSKEVRERTRQEMEKIRSTSKLAFEPLCMDEIGHGGFGHVFKETPPGSAGKPWAVKRIFRQRSPQFGIERDNIFREIVTSALLMQSQSDFFVKFFGWCDDEHYVYLAMEYVELGDLEKNLVEPWSEEDTKLVTQQLLRGLAIMHSSHITHRDLKPQNVFLVSRGPPPRVKIGDFGISKRVPEGSSSRMNTAFSTQGYTALEVTNGEQHTTAVDLWSLACLIYRMVIGKRLFKSDFEAVLRYDTIVAGLDNAIAGKLHPDGAELLKWLLARDPKCRPTASKALSHAWFRE